MPVYMAPAQATLFLERLSLRVQNARVGEVTPDMISPIFLYLDPAKIPSSSTRSRPACRLQFQAFLVIMGCNKHLRADPALVARFMQPDGWPRIWKWIQFLHDKCVVEKVFGEEVCATTVDTIGVILQALGRSPTSRDVVARTPGVLTLVVKEWLADDGRYAIAACMYLGGNDRAISGALDVLIDRHEGELELGLALESIVPQVLDAAGGDAKLVAGTVLTRLREAVATESAQQIELHLSLVDRLANNACSPVHLALLNAGMIPAIIAALSWYNSVTLHAAPAQVLLLCYNILIDSVFSMNDPSWAVQAIDAGLITALLRSGKRIRALNDPELADPLVDLLSDSLPPYLIFRSVLRAVRRALKQVYKRNLEATGALWDAWTDFEELAEDRLWLLDEWDCEGERDRHRRCSRPLCDNGGGSTTKLCSGCLGPLYCSKECQKLDWPAHRSSCKAARQTVQGSYPRSLPINLTFVANCAPRCRRR
ncbi:hypothetical protein PLICRDRAFT_43728 [Plicaturopsis crispa FD-325 SS-3]|nr:hypothetical protein PLICRDRAFT_43728 [Plicaturopsis crispa FD-325 SS-3]